MSASPERLVSVRNRTVETRPIKGTRPRTGQPLVDIREQERLLASQKDRAENLMIVDLMRNDLASVCEDDSICVTQLCQPESYQSVLHLVSAVEGQLKPDFKFVRFAGGDFPRRVDHRCAEDPGDGDHCRTRADGAGSLLRIGRVLGFRWISRFEYFDSNDHGFPRLVASAGRRRSRSSIRSGGRV